MAHNGCVQYSIAPVWLIREDCAAPGVMIDSCGPDGAGLVQDWTRTEARC